ncbi:MAG: fibrinogen-like YCDxxxxGGGW domain-containing protein, partial [Nanoarchaeota archaeon]
MQKKGLSDIISTVLIILLVLVGIAILGVYILKGVIDVGSKIENVDVEGIKLSIVPESVKIAKSGQENYVLLNVLREAGEGTLGGVNVIVKDASGKTQVKKIEGEIKEYETKTIGFFIGGISDVKEVSVSPILKKDSGEEVLSKEFESYSISSPVPQASPSTIPTPDGGLIVTDTSGQNTYLPVGTGLVSYWGFDGRAEDISGNGNDGTITGNVVFADGLAGKAAKFDGGHISVPDKDALDLSSGEFSFSVWIKVSGKNGVFDGSKETNYHILHKEDYRESPGESTGWMFRVNDGKPEDSGRSDIRTNKNNIHSEYLSWITPRAIIKDRWHHVVAVRTNIDTGNNILFYIDGILREPGEAKDNNANLKLPAPNALPLLIGGGGGQPFYGLIDDLMIFKKALTASEVESLYLSHPFLGQTENNPGASCKDILNKQQSRGDGAYWIDTDGAGTNEPFQAYCDMTTDGGGWTIIYAQTVTLVSPPGPRLLSDNELSFNRNPIGFQNYNLNLNKKMAISSISTESLIKRKSGKWIKMNHALFDEKLKGFGDQHPHWEVEITSNDGTKANAFAGYSNLNNHGGGDFGITKRPITATCITSDRPAGIATTNGFDHHDLGYHHLNCGCEGHYLYGYNGYYNVNTLIGLWDITDFCTSGYS